MTHPALVKPAGGRRVGAVVVSYNGGPRLLETIGALREQTERVFVVDNGSGEDSQTVLSQSEGGGVRVLRNAVNCGVARALNQGVSAAIEEGCEWVLTMDQDSVARPGMVAEMLECEREVSENLLVGALTPRVADSRMANVASAHRGPRWETRRSAITSGNLVRASVYSDIGGYDEGLFIDSVDFDFCLRLRRRGYSIVRCNEAVLSHALGSLRERKVLGRPYRYVAHPPARQYYMLRNHVVITRRYGARFPLFCARKQVAMAANVLRTILFEPSRRENLKAMMKGLYDGFRFRDPKVAAHA